MRKYLVLEDDQAFVDGTYKPFQRDSASGESAFELIFVSTVEEARRELATGRFSGAILDLRLSGSEAAEGNQVAIQIYRDYFMPIAVVTGFEDELDQDIRTIVDTGGSFIQLFNKNVMIGLVFEFLLKIEQSGVLQIVGPGGELNQVLSAIFWKHLGPFLKQWDGQTLDVTARKRILRHAVAHMLGALQSHETGIWDKYLPGEIYIWPPICANEMTGDIYAELENGVETDRHHLLVTPSCDLASKTAVGAVRHFIKILPFSLFANEGKMANLTAKKEHRYHLLPPTSIFRGGIADFASISTVLASDMNRNFIRKGTVIEPFWRELIARLGAWLGRQGTPEFDKEALMKPIRGQWAALTKKAV